MTTEQLQYQLLLSETTRTTTTTRYMTFIEWSDDKLFHFWARLFANVTRRSANIAQNPLRYDGR